MTSTSSAWATAMRTIRSGRNLLVAAAALLGVLLAARQPSTSSAGSESATIWERELHTHLAEAGLVLLARFVGAHDDPCLVLGREGDDPAELLMIRRVRGSGAWSVHFEQDPRNRAVRSAGDALLAALEDPWARSAWRAHRSVRSIPLPRGEVLPIEEAIRLWRRHRGADRADGPDRLTDPGPPVDLLR